jgi:hypothetical protein
MEVGYDGRRERVRRTSMAVDLAAVGEAVSEAPAWTRWRSGRQPAWHRGGRRGGAGMWCGPDGGRGCDRQGVRVDLMTVNEASAVQELSWSRSGRVGGGEMIVARVAV